MQPAASFSPTPLEIAAIILSALSLITAIWAARSAKKEAEAAANQYKLSVEQHRQTLFSNVVVYVIQDHYDLLDRQLTLGITNAGQVPVVSVHVELVHSDSSDLVHSLTIPILSQQETKTIPIGDNLYRFLERISAITYTPTGHKVESSKPIQFILKCEWTPSVATSSATDSLLWKLVLEGKLDKGKPPTFGISLEVTNEHKAYPQ